MHFPNCKKYLSSFLVLGSLASFPMVTEGTDKHFLRRKVQEDQELCLPFVPRQPMYQSFTYLLLEFQKNSNNSYAPSVNGTQVAEIYNDLTIKACSSQLGVIRRIQNVSEFSPSAYPLITMEPSPLNSPTVLIEIQNFYCNACGINDFKIFYDALDPVGKENIEIFDDREVCDCRGPSSRDFVTALVTKLGLMELKNATQIPLLHPKDCDPIARTTYSYDGVCPGSSNPKFNFFTPPPTSFPTEEPTTEAPTEVPTDAPTDAPTYHPTDVPTDYPTDDPTSRPTQSPTLKPTPSPTGFPTNPPTDGRSANPTSTPTVAPTENPTTTPPRDSTTSPTGAPTASPTITYTGSPTGSPTNLRTGSPTVVPTSLLSVAPNDLQTVPPTLSPTNLRATSSPTPAPSNLQTASPTGSPSTSVNPPTDVPTESPVEPATDSSTDAPVDPPTDVPTESPIELATDSPTDAPVDPPTDVPTDSQVSVSADPFLLGGQDQN